ncbi:hypothetical protein Golomagni_01974 [Golovinomyces magnicellulatus]|nr:hypothetical protein Golomagni_01974 [Golovinomyces magnicellulatus]
MQKNKAVITGDILKNQSSKLWDSLPQFEDRPKPKFSSGWLEGFKHRYKIREFFQFGEAASAETDNLNAISQMDIIRLLAFQYGPYNTLNMDETNMFWKLTPDRTLATKAGSGGKKSKDRVSLALTCNGDGSEKLEPWIIGKSKNPRCTKNINRRLLRVVYRWKKSKWMTGLIMQEYLIWLDNKMQAQANGPGYIATFKLQYRKLWVHYMLRQYEAGKDPNKTVLLLKAIQWTRVAWAEGVSPTCVQRCWWKSTVLGQHVGLKIVEENLEADRDELQKQINELPGIEDRLSVGEFIELGSEVVDDEDQDIFASVIERYSIDRAGIVEEAEDGDIETEKVSNDEALKAIDIVRSWELQQEDGQTTIVQVLDNIEKGMQLAKLESKKQTTLDSYFMCL